MHRPTRRAFARLTLAVVSAVSATAFAAGTPYTGTPAAVPGTIEAENFDKGGEGQGYHDLSSGNSGGQYRTSESVDIIASADSAGGGYVVNNFQTGEWMAYTVNVTQAATYEVALRVSNNYTTLTPAFHVEVDGVNVTGTVTVPNTGSWGTFQWVAKQGIVLGSGTHVLKVVADAQYFNVNSVRLAATGSVPSTTSTPYTGTPVALPATFEAENFDKGGEGLGYHDLSAGNSGGQYRTAENVDIIASTDSIGGGYVVNNFQAGEWLAYTVSVATAGAYDVSVRAANNYTSARAFHVEVDGVNATGSVSIPVTGSWSTFQWVTKTGVNLAAGQHVLKVVSDVEYFNLNSVRVAASAAAPTPAPAPSPLPSTNTRAIPTFESLGLYWTPPSDPGAGGCTVRYRKTGDAAWKDGLAMWYDARNKECRGSLVQLAPGTPYDVQFGLPGQQPIAQLAATTWPNTFPIAKTVVVGSSNQTLNITEGGSATGYVLYTPAAGTTATIDVQNAQPYSANIAASYVILRGFTLKGGQVDGVRIQPTIHDVVIENNDISGWGRYDHTNARGWQIGTNQDSGVASWCGTSPTLERVIIQRNRIHDPRYGSNSWSEGHPSGPNGIMFSHCGGNHVFRYNELYSADEAHYFMDAMGGEENFSSTGFPNADTDINGNIIKSTWDDAIEAEGGDRNVRVWGNYIDQTNTAVATTVTDVGPIYIFRNVYNRSRHLSETALDSDDRSPFGKQGTANGYGNGRRYVFHNTLLQAAPPAGTTYTLGAGLGMQGSGTNQPISNTISRNNIFHIWKPWWSAIDVEGSPTVPNDFDYDLYNGNIVAYRGAEANGIVGTPIYAPGNGPTSESGGMYQLAPSSPGYDRGVRLPNFNDDALGAGPDMGAHEAGSAAMKFGVTAGTP